MIRFIAVSILAIGWAAAAEAQAPPAPSQWKNTRGSILEISSVDANGAITGKFTNNASGTLCIGTPFDIVGKALKTGFFFGVTFSSPCNTIVSWRGPVTGNTITMSFALSYIDKDDGGIETTSGIDIFTQQ